MNIRSLFLVSLIWLSLLSAPLLAQEETVKLDLRIGVLPVLDMLPLFFAQDAGYFEEEGITVELQLFQSGRAIREALLTGEVDGIHADTFSALWVSAAGVATRTVRHVELESTYFAMIAAAGSGLKSASDLVGARIGISENTIIQYLTEQMVVNAGLNVDQVELVGIPSIRDRFKMLVRDEIDAATLPQPYIALAIEFFDTPILSESGDLPYVPEGVHIRAEVLMEQGAAVRALLRAYERAVQTMNADPLIYREVLIPNMELPRRLFMIPEAPVFAEASLPSEEDIVHAVEWALAVGLIGEAQSYEEVVDGSFLPEMMAEE